MRKITIVDIPKKMERYFGGKGKMLHPNIDMVEDLVRLIPFGKITTIEGLAKKLASDFETDVTCPMRTGNAIKKITERYLGDVSNNEVPYWRIVKKNQEIINSKYVALCASKLEDEGFSLSYLKSKKIKVNFNNDKLFAF